MYAIRPGRSFDDAVTILGADFAGVLVRDGWAPYRRFTGALHQSCLAHLFRRCRTLRADHPRSPLGSPRAGRPHRRPRAPRSAGCPRDHRAGPRWGPRALACPPGPAHRHGAPLCRRPNASPGISDREFPAVLAFLWAPDVDATNWRAEHAIRPAVVNRQICGRESDAPRRTDPTGPRECGPHRASTPCRPRRPLHLAAAGAAVDGPRGFSPPDAVGSPARRKTLL